MNNSEFKNAQQSLQHRASALPPGVLPRGLSRKASAEYIGVSPSKFDEMVRDGLMPTPKRVGGRVIWDRLELDEAFDDLPGSEDANRWDEVLDG